MLCPPHSTAPLVERWLDRHRHPASFILHMVGIPATIIGVLLAPVYLVATSVYIFLLALALFVGGYLIQFLGHALDGTEPGEIALLRRWWGRRFAVSVRTAESQGGVA
jgi:hypothetical protein